MKLKNILFQACALAGGTIILSSCNDFLDREPLSSVTPEVYFSTTDHFEAYSIAKYNNWFSSHAGYKHHFVYNGSALVRYVHHQNLLLDSKHPN